jgi:hypothetical protein
MPPGSTLILGAVIVTVMSWECSLSPSSVIEGGEVSQLMLAGRVFLAFRHGHWRWSTVLSEVKEVERWER